MTPDDFRRLGHQLIGWIADRSHPDRVETGDAWSWIPTCGPAPASLFSSYFVRDREHLTCAMSTSPSYLRRFWALKPWFLLVDDAQWPAAHARRRVAAPWELLQAEASRSAVDRGELAT